MPGELSGCGTGWLSRIMKAIRACVLLMLGGGILWCAGVKVASGEFSKKMVLTGFLQAQKAEHLVVPRSNAWQVQIKWMAPEGSFLEAGDVAVRFDTSNLASEIENLELTLEDKVEQKKQKDGECRMERKSLELQLQMAEIEVKKKELDAAIPKGLIADYEYEKNQLELKKSQEARAEALMEKNSRFKQMYSEIGRLKIEIREAEVKLQNYQDMLAGLTLRAKSGGTLMYDEHPWHRRKIQIGDNVGSTWTVATIPDNGSLYVEAWADESGFNSLKPGQKVAIVMDAYPKKKFSGVIGDVMNNAEKKNRWGKSHYFQVKITLDRLDRELMKPGMSVKCDITLQHYDDALLVPLEMIHREDADMWVQVAGEPPAKIEGGVIGQNEFFLALGPGGRLAAGTRLEAVDGRVVKEMSHE